MKKSILGIFVLQIIMSGCATISSLSSNAIPRTNVSLSGTNASVNTPYGNVNTQMKKPKIIQLEGQFLRKSKDTTFIISVQKSGNLYKATFSKVMSSVDTIDVIQPLSTYQIGKDFAFLDTQNKVVFKYISGYPNGIKYLNDFYKQF